MGHSSCIHSHEMRTEVQRAHESLVLTAKRERKKNMKNRIAGQINGGIAALYTTYNTS